MAIADHLVDKSAWARLAKPTDISVLHYDRDSDVIAEVTGQPVEWVVPPGTAD